MNCKGVIPDYISDHTGQQNITKYLLILVQISSFDLFELIRVQLRLK